MLNYLWPIVVVITSNTLYHLCTKSAPGNVNVFASLTVTYSVSALVAAALFILSGGYTNVVQGFKTLNWTSVAFGFVLVALETGWMYVYRAGWQVSVATIVQSSVLALVLILIGYFIYNEALTWNKIVGVIICLVGLGVINFK